MISAAYRRSGYSARHDGFWRCVDVKSVRVASSFIQQYDDNLDMTIMKKIRKRRGRRRMALKNSYCLYTTEWNTKDNSCANPGSRTRPVLNTSTGHQHRDREPGEQVTTTSRGYKGPQSTERKVEAPFSLGHGVGPGTTNRRATTFACPQEQRGSLPA